MPEGVYHISNPILQIGISAKGAELQSIFHSLHHLEYLWQGNPEYWGKRSPILFPIVGALKDGHYLYHDKKYPLPRHGFAREKTFHLTHQTENSITLSLAADSDTLAVYPFDFMLTVTYTLEKNRLSVTYMVENKGADNLYFSIGAHPAFNVPIVKGTTFSDYLLSFEKKETIAKWPLSSDGLLDKPAIPFFENNNQLNLNKKLFSADALVFKNMQSTSISINSTKTIHGVIVHFNDFPYMGIWSTKEADFVCIEPWCGIADSTDANGKIEDKEGIYSLSKDKIFTRTWSVDIF